MKDIYLGLPLGIGSLPYKDPKKACEVIVDYFPESPFWPELSRRDFKESIGFIQSEGIPGIIVDNYRQQIYLDKSTDLTDQLENFYTSFIENDFDGYGITGEYASGLEVMIETIKERRPAGLKVIKGQLSGPTTFGLVIKDQENKAILYDEQLMDVLLKNTILKARWMINRFKEIAAQTVIFFDEPMFQSIGSAAVPIDRDKAVNYLKELINGVDCVTGAHCCGNTDWSMLIETGVDILAFDAYHFTDTLALYPESLSSHLSGGGSIAWGIVPASDEAADHSIESLYDKLLESIKMISKTGIEEQLLMRRSVITPSCGLGSLSERLAERILELTRGVSDILRKELD